MKTPIISNVSFHMRAERHVRTARAGLVAALCCIALVVFAALLALPLQAEAQDVTLVSNFSDVSSSNSVTIGEFASSTHVSGTEFTTGTNADGYLLKSLTFRIYQRDTGSTPKVSIYTSVSDEPGSELYTFADPSAGTGTKVVTAQANATLVASTSYFVVFEDSNTATGRWNVRRTNTFTNYDTDSLTDWSLSGRIHSSDGGTTWGGISTSQKVAMKLIGEVVGTTSNNAPVFSDATLTRSVAENSASGVSVGAVIPEATDADSDTLSYSMEGTNAASFDFNSTSRQITTKSGVTYDHEAKSSYSVTIKADDGNGGTDTVAVTITVTDVDEPPAAPAAPTVSATSGSTTRLDVSWSAPANNGKPAITSYDLRYRVGSSGAWTNGPQGVTTLSITHLGLMAGTEYQWQVRATNDEGDSDWSDSGTGSTNPPTNNAPVFSDATLTRSIAENTAANTNVGAAIPAATDADSDTLSYSMGGTDASSFDFNTMSRQITTKSGVTYDHEAKSSYSVTVTASDGTDSASVAVTITVTDADEPPSAPGAPGVAPTSGSNTSLNVSWTAPGNAGKPAIASYDVRYREGTSGGFTNGPQDVTATSTTITGLTEGTDYQVQVRATNDEGDSPWSASGSGSTSAVTPTLTAVAVTSTPQALSDTYGEGEKIKFTVTFSVPVEISASRPHFEFSLDGVDTDAAYESGADTTELVFAYTVLAADMDDNGIWIGNQGRTIKLTSGEYIRGLGNGPTAVLTHAVLGTQSVHKVDGSLTTGNNPPVFSDTTLPRTIAENTAANTNVGAAIPAATDADGDGLTYSMEGANASSFDFNATTRQISTKAGVIYDYESKSSYSVNIKADDGNGGTDTLDVTISLTDVDEPPAAPAAPSVSSTSGSTTSIDVSWAAPANNGKPAITSYDLRYRVGTIGSWTNGPQNVTTTSSAITGLTADTSYQVQVRATNDEGDSDWSDSGTGSTNSLHNNAPVFSDATLTRSIAENTAANTNVGAAIPAATDADGDTLTYSMEGTNADSFDFNATTRQITTKTGITYDFEVKSSYSVTIKADDGNGGTDTVAVTINVTKASTTVRAPVVEPEGPRFGSAVVTGTSLVLTFDGALDEGLVPAPGSFKVLADGTTVTVTDVRVNGSEVTLTLAGSVAGAGAVTVAYSPPAMNPLRGASSGRIRAFGDQTVEPEGPRFGSAVVTGTSLVLTFDEPLDEGSVPAASAFTVKVTPSGGTEETRALVGTAVTVTDVRVNGSEVTLTLADSVAGAGAVTVAYSPPAMNPLRGASSGRIRAFGDQTVEVVRPEVVPDVEVLSMTEGGSAAYTLVLTAPPSGPLTVTPRVVGDDDVTVAPSRLVFTAANWADPQMVTVTAAHDADNVDDAATVEHDVSGVDHAGAPTPGVRVEVRDDNSDATLQAWTSRFGRTVAEQVIGGVEGRFSASRTAGVEMTLAGERIGWTDAEPGAAETHSQAMAQWLQGADDGGTARVDYRSRAVTSLDLLTGSSFALTGESASGGMMSLWGRGAVSQFDGREGDLSLDGEVSSMMLGADWAQDHWTAGLLVSQSEGDGGYLNPESEPGSETGTGGRIESTLAGLFPYGRYEMNERLTLWGIAGYGTGKLTLTPEDQTAIRTGTDLMMGAVGLHRVAVEAPEAPAEGGIELVVKTDALAVRTTTDEVQGDSDDTGNLAATEADVTRLRLGLEGTWRGLTVGAGTLSPVGEIGLRRDDGDAETGFGVDLGVGFSWSDPSLGLRAGLAARGLLSHKAKGFRERGIAGSFTWDPAPGTDRGPLLTLTQTMGARATGGMDTLFGRTTLAGLAANDDGDDLERRRLEAKLGYGFALFDGQYTGTPSLGMGLSNGNRDYTLGWRLVRRAEDWGSAELSFEAGRSEGVDSAPEHGVGLTFIARF